MGFFGSNKGKSRIFKPNARKVEPTVIDPGERLYFGEKFRMYNAGIEDVNGLWALITPNLAYSGSGENGYPNYYSYFEYDGGPKYFIGFHPDGDGDTITDPGWFLKRVDDGSMLYYTATGGNIENVEWLVHPDNIGGGPAPILTDHVEEHDLWLRPPIMNMSNPLPLGDGSRIPVYKDEGTEWVNASDLRNYVLGAYLYTFQATQSGTSAPVITMDAGRTTGSIVITPSYAGVGAYRLGLSANIDLAKSYIISHGTLAGTTGAIRTIVHDFQAANRIDLYTSQAGVLTNGLLSRTGFQFVLWPAA